MTAQSRKHPPPRQGPRPLPLHLATAQLTWLSSLAALPRLRDGSLPWSPALAEAGAALSRSLAGVDPDEFSGAVQAEVCRRQSALLAGIAGYRAHPYRREARTRPIAWQRGSTRLVDYRSDPTGRAGGARPLIVIPSLINRAYILDLTPRTSLMGWLASQGFDPFLVDWDHPGSAERGFGLSDYVSDRLIPCLEQVSERTGARPAIIGYCMGGLLALALAQKRPDVTGLALLATPWDFHAGYGAQARLAATGLASFGPLLDQLGVLPVDVIQAFFAALDPQGVSRKFIDFAGLDQGSEKARNFVALEDWLNDGVPLVAPVAQECLAGWYGRNTTATGGWLVDGEAVDPRRLAVPALCLVPAQDRIVPPASAEALAAALPEVEVLRPAVGHIGMIVSNAARKRVWRPLGTWLEDRFRT